MIVRDHDVVTPDNFSTLGVLLQYWAEHQSGKLAFAYLADGEREEARLTYSELYHHAVQIATRLRECAQSGDRVLLLYPSGLEYIAAFFGCMYAGLVPVPVYPPRENTMGRFNAIVHDCQPTIVMGMNSDQGTPRKSDQFPDLKGLHCLETPALKSSRQAGDSPGPNSPEIKPEDIAFLQYTSGSTSVPRGVMVSHAALMHNLSAIKGAYGGYHEMMFVSWLPLYHDMGLIGQILEAVYLGASCVLMSPVSFVQQPVRWLKAVSDYHGVVSGGPNFAYDLCVRKVTPEQKKGLDLSSWQIAFNGAEPIRGQTLEQFASAFANCGFGRHALCPSYGLAESTLLVSCRKVAEGVLSTSFDAASLKQGRATESANPVENTRELVSCGRGIQDQEIAIVSPDTLKCCEDGQIGEIWVRGQDIAKGYWNNAEATKETFHNYLAETGDGPFLRTGDLGFIYKQELFITGRLKDLIIVHGTNHYPQDIEATVSHAHPALSSGAAFSIGAEGEEELAIVQEVLRSHVRKLDAPAIVDAIRCAVATQHELDIHAIELVKPGGVPKTSSGKIQRVLCREKFLSGSLPALYRSVRDGNADATASSAVPESGPTRHEAVPSRMLIRWVNNVIAEEIARAKEVHPESIQHHRSFLDLGISSVEAIEITGKLEHKLGVILSPVLCFEFPTIQQLGSELVRRFEPVLRSRSAGGLTPEGGGGADPVANYPVPVAGETGTSGCEQDIAIIGISCRFPGANDLSSYWELLKEGRDAVTEIPRDRWDWHLNYSSDPEEEGKTYSRWGGFLKGVELFDAAFFNISPHEARLMDPQQRIFLETAWETFEHAGYSPGSLANRQVGVYVGASYNEYAARIASTLEHSDHAAGMGNLNAVIPNRVSFCLNLHGPSLFVDTLCSSSLTALHLACEGLKAGECSMALAGGVNILLSPEHYLGISRMKAHSADGRCKPFDHRANGMVSAEGVASVLLKPLAAALKDRDTVYAVIKGSAVNHGGQVNGLSAPNPIAHAQAIRKALDVAGVSADSISYVEAHGTGTSLGDPIEIEGLTKAFRQDTARSQFCAIGSVKSNLGHLEPVSGMAGIIKVVLAMQNKQLPPTLHFEKSNPLITFEASPFRVNSELAPWNAETPRRAGVSSFGMGGSNAHVIVEEAPAQMLEEGESQPLHPLLTLSAKTETALRTQAGRYASFLGANPDCRLSDVCFTANAGRSHFTYRLAAVEHSAAALQRELKSFADGNHTKALVLGKAPETKPVEIAFLFTGQGSQHSGMGRDLYAREAVFRNAIDRCSEILKRHLKECLPEILYSQNEADGLQKNPIHAQAALFAVEHALTELWKSWGVVPDVVMGHSLGEYAAAHVAGVFNLEVALELVVQRACLMQEHAVQPGAMAVVFAREKIVYAHLAPYKARAAIAAINGPENIVISGDKSCIIAIVQQLESQKISSEWLDVTHAFHSPLLDPVLPYFESAAKEFEFRSPGIQLVSNVTGKLFEAGAVPDASYWTRHMREPVRFADGLKTVAQQGIAVFLEVGPSASLVSIAKRCSEVKHVPGFPSLLAGQNDRDALMRALGNLYAHGAQINWAAVHGEAHRRIALPTYPFERRRFWVDFSGAEPEGDRQSPKEISMNPSHEALISPAAMIVPPAVLEGQKAAILQILRELVARFLEMDANQIDNHKSFLEMGADSLVLVRAVQAIRGQFRVAISIKQLFEQYSTLDTLSEYILENTNVGIPAVGRTALTTETKLEMTSIPLARQESGERSSATVAALPSAGELERIFSLQLSTVSNIINQQINILRTGQLVHPENVSAQSDYVSGPASKLPTGNLTGSVDGKISRERAVAKKTELFTPYGPIRPGTTGDMSEKQREHLDSFIARYTSKTKQSKNLTEQYRSVLSDNRASAGFRYSVKEMLYPIHAERSKGARIWDVDGNEYVDLTMGFGVNLFGHNAPFIIDAIKAPLNDGMQLGPQSPIAGEVAGLVSELTGMDRVTFCNSGTEAVMMAVRLARTSTERRKIAIFAGSYHGTWDGVLAQEEEDDEHGLHYGPMAPGIMPGAIEDILVLEYGSDRALELIEANGDTLAAVLVEPVQSRRPDLQPKEFLQGLRRITRQKQVALIFDEVITGFRIAPGGAQEWFGVKADIATYGKIAGGGMPIGIIAGSAEFMNGIDGGCWSYGDLSYPSSETTFFAGTFCKHPLAMAAAKAVLTKLKQDGRSLQNQLSSRTAGFANYLNSYFESIEVPLRVVHFGSLFRFAFRGNLDLLFYHLLDHGIYIWEGRNCFLSTSHTDQDIEEIIKAVQASVACLQEAGFLPGHLIQEPLTLPATEAQKEIWPLCHAGKAASLAYHLAVPLFLRGTLQMQCLRDAIRTVMGRHQALRSAFSADGETQSISPIAQMQIEEVDLNSAQENGHSAAVLEWLKKDAKRTFHLSGSYLWRVAVLKLHESEHVLVITVHHLIADGWSVGVLLDEISKLYSAAVEGRHAVLPPALDLRECMESCKAEDAGSTILAAEQFWQERLNAAPEVRLPSNVRRSRMNSATRFQQMLEPNLLSRLSTATPELGGTLFMVLLSAYQVFLWQLTGQDDLIVVVPVAGQTAMENAQAVCDCSNLMAVRSQVHSQSTFADCVRAVRQYILDADAHQYYPFVKVIRKLRPQRDLTRWPFLNIDRPLHALRFSGLEIETVPSAIQYASFDFSLNITLFDGKGELTIDYKTSLFSADTVAGWAQAFVELLEKIASTPCFSLAELPLFNQNRGELQPSTSLSQNGEARTATQEQLLAIWREILGHEQISIFDDFFDLGCHSLLATQVISRLREVFDVDVPMETLFKNTTVASLSEYLEIFTESPLLKAPPILPFHRNESVPLSFSQRRLWAIHQLEPQSTAYNLVGAARLRGKLDAVALQKAFDELVRRHESLRTVFRLEGGIPFQHVLLPQSLNMALLDFSALNETEAEKAISKRGQEVAREPFDLRSGPLLRVDLVRLRKDDHAVIIVIHHIVSDGWSLGVLIRDVGRSYLAFASGRELDLPELPIQFKDYAVWQRDWLQGKVLDEQLEHWTRSLQDVPAFISLPPHGTRINPPSTRGAYESFAFSEESANSLRQLCRQENVTLFMALLATFSLLLSRYTGEEDFVIGTDIANRNRIETEDLIGCFVNLLPLRMRLAGDPTFREYLQQIRRTTLSAYAHQDVPFDQLVRALRLERKLTGTPLVQVLFVLQNVPASLLETEMIKIEPIPVSMETAEFELILAVEETQDSLRGAMGYSIDLFEQPIITAMIARLLTLVQQVVSNPDSHLSSFSLLNEKEKAIFKAEDFSDVGIDQKDLDSLVLRLSASAGI